MKSILGIVFLSVLLIFACTSKSLTKQEGEEIRFKILELRISTLEHELDSLMEANDNDNYGDDE